MSAHDMNTITTLSFQHHGQRTGDSWPTHHTTRKYFVSITKMNGVWHQRHFPIIIHNMCRCVCLFALDYALTMKSSRVTLVGLKPDWIRVCVGGWGWSILNPRNHVLSFFAVLKTTLPIHSHTTFASASSREKRSMTTYTWNFIVDVNLKEYIWTRQFTLESPVEISLKVLFSSVYSALILRLVHHCARNSMIVSTIMLSTKILPSPYQLTDD